MTESTIGELWSRLIEPDLSGFQEGAESDQFEDWSAIQNFGSAAWSELSYGLEIAYGRMNSKLVALFMDRSKSIATRAIKEDDWERGPARKDLHPRSRGIAQVVLVYARGLLGESPSLAPMLSGASDLMAWANRQDDYAPDITHAFALYAARCYLIGGDAEQALEVMRAFDYRFHAREASVLKAVCKAAVATPSGPIADVKVRDRLESYFDRVRHPNFRGYKYFDLPSVQRWEYALIRQKWFVSKSRRLGWKAAVKSVSA